LGQPKHEITIVKGYWHDFLLQTKKASTMVPMGLPAGCKSKITLD
jgi:hypothetical protein